MRTCSVRQQGGTKTQRTFPYKVKLFLPQREMCLRTSSMQQRAWKHRGGIDAASGWCCLEDGNAAAPTQNNESRTCNDGHTLSKRPKEKLCKSSGGKSHGSRVRPNQTTEAGCAAGRLVWAGGMLAPHTRGLVGPAGEAATAERHPWERRAVSRWRGSEVQQVK